jgi:hypothetical protein
MDAHARNPDDLTDLERRLAGWRPDAAGLDPDAMLFAAGRASVRPGPGRFVWPAVAGCLAVAAVALGGWAAAERKERLALARLLEKPAPAAPAVAPEPSPSPAPPVPGSYLAVTRLIRQDPDAWLARAPAGAPPARPPAAPPTLRAWPLEP